MMEIIRSRLVEADATQFRFVKTDDGDPTDSEDKNESLEEEGGESRGVASAKTVIWEAYYKAYAKDPDGNTYRSDTHQHYFATVLSTDDRVEESFLRKYIKARMAGAESSTTGSLSIRIASPLVAEELTGCRVGTIPPVAHNVSMRVYLDQALIISEEEKGKDGVSTPRMISVGAGEAGFNLHISVEDLIRLCEGTSCGLHICPMSRASARVERNKRIKGVQQQVSKTPSQRLRTAAGKRGRANVVSEIIEEAGDNFPELVRVGADGNYTKNALHLAAWKGDLESIRMLVDTGKTFDLDLVNIISIGEGNHGKTPIFYSITQSRDDAVSLLLTYGANLLIINNKGQSPCSLAVSHLEPGTCQKMYRLEALQLQSGGSFVNYRETHSDEQKYGDLDPRFEIDVHNLDDDIVAEIETHRWITKEDEDQDEDHKFCESYGNSDDFTTVRTPGGLVLPRSLRRTNWTMRKERCAEYRTSVANDKAGIAELQLKHSNTKKSKRRNKNNEVKEDPLIIDGLDCLVVDEVLSNNCNGDTDRCIYVSDEKGLACLSDAVEKSLMPNDSLDTTNDGSRLFEISWGLDCEWKPARTSGHENPVATLQLSDKNGAYLVDLQNLCQPLVKDPDAPLTDLEVTLSNILTKLLADDSIIIVGFGIGQDIGKLAASFPHLPCFQIFQSVIDLQSVTRVLFPDSGKNYMSSLQKMVAILLGKRLDKTQQCSNWEERPLTEPQSQYAMLDAAVLPCLLRKLLERDCVIQEQVRSLFQHNRYTIRLTCLRRCPAKGELRQTGHRVDLGSVKNILSLEFAKQTWPTVEEAPELPVEIPLDHSSINNVRRSSRTATKEEKETQKRAKKEARALRKKTAIKLQTLSADHNSSPEPGTVLGYTKETCIYGVLGENVVETLSDCALSFNRRGGVVEMANAWLFFINFAGRSKTLYNNEFSDDGKRIDFTVKLGNHTNASLLWFLSKPAFHKPMKLLLFIKQASNSKYVYCGSCRFVGKEQSGGRTDGGEVTLRLELVDHEALAKADVMASYHEVIVPEEALRG